MAEGQSQSLPLSGVSAVGTSAYLQKLFSVIMSAPGRGGRLGEGSAEAHQASGKG